MRIIARSTLKMFWEAEGREESREPLQAWFAIARAAQWSNPSEIKAQFASASFVGDRVVFNIAGNKYRLVTFIRYDFKTVYIRFVGTHAEYDKIDVESV
jgi:mRNA interferase HigB